MTAWQERTIEQRNLLNPAFCAIAVWHLARGYRAESTALAGVSTGLPLELSFVGASLVLRAQHGLLALDGRRLEANDTQTKKINAYLRASSDEVRECMRQATFVGRWLCKAGAPPTVLALVGVQA